MSGAAARTGKVSKVMKEILYVEANDGVLKK